MTVGKPKPKQLLRPITTGANSAMNQSQFLAITCNLLTAREKSRVHRAIGFGFAPPRGTLGVSSVNEKRLFHGKSWKARRPYVHRALTGSCRKKRRRIWWGKLLCFDWLLQQRVPKRRRKSLSVHFRGQSSCWFVYWRPLQISTENNHQSNLQPLLVTCTTPVEWQVKSNHFRPFWYRSVLPRVHHRVSADMKEIIPQRNTQIHAVGYSVIAPSFVSTLSTS